MDLTDGLPWRWSSRRLSSSVVPRPAGELYDAGLEQAAEAGEHAGAAGRSAPGGPGAAQGTPADPLYGWDGGVVPTAEPGDIAASASPSARGLEPSLEGRMHILELYQEVLDERDALRDEVDALRAALASSRETADGARATSARDEERLAELEQSRRALIEENRLLLGRLTTAQVRRLEAEKLLVETQMAWFDQRAKQPGASAPVSFISGEGERP